MVDFVQLQQAMKERLVRDRAIRTIEAEGATLEEAVAEAATMLNLSIRHIEYEITARGFPGFMGVGAKSWTIKAYERLTTEIAKEEEEVVEETDKEVEVRIDRDGEAYVHLLYDGAYLKVVPPLGHGKKVNSQVVMRMINTRKVANYVMEQIEDVIKEEAGTYMRIGDFQAIPANDTMVSVDVTADEMKASITVIPPGEGGRDLAIETYLSILRGNKVNFGVDEKALSEFVDKPLYKESFQVAAGIRPADGNDSYVKYNFEIEHPPKVRLQENASGRIDFKELNIIQNVVQDQILAVKVPAEKGTAGRTITNKVIPAKNGRDMALPLGKNVHVGDDDISIISDINGQVLLIGGKINVEPVYTVQGNVNIKTGNIIFLGTVKVTGNVEDSYSVKASGNIEVSGTVEKAELDAEGDIIVHQGITGRNDILIHAGRSLWARFIENAQVQVGNMVVVSDGIINSQVDAYKRIICNGKRASIVGGRLRATEEINAKSIGSPTSGTETICEVGFDPKTKEQLDALELRKADMDKQLEEVQLNIQTLINIKKQRKSLPEDKELYLSELMDKRQQLTDELGKIRGGIDEIQQFLASLRTRGRVSASFKVFPGVKIYIREVKEDVRNEYRAVTFVLEDGLVRVTKYEEPDEEANKGPDGFITS